MRKAFFVCLTFGVVLTGCNSNIACSSIEKNIAKLLDTASLNVRAQNGSFTYTKRDGLVCEGKYRVAEKPDDDFVTVDKDSIHCKEG